LNRRTCTGARCHWENEVANVKALLFIICFVLAATLGNAGTVLASQNRNACIGVDMNLSPSRRHGYERLVASAVGQKVRPSEVTINKFLSSGPWSVVYADVRIADPGYFFFQATEGRKRFEDVWGGMAESSDCPN
jgi:hypothetical protein